MGRKIAVLSVLAGVLILFSGALGAVRLVPGEYATIQAAVDDAISLDEVVVADGVYTGAGNRDIDFGGKAITVRSENGPTNCIIDCNGSPNEPHRGFIFESDEGPNSVLEGFTIIRGYSTGQSALYGSGGAILCFEAMPKISNCIFHGNVTEYRGGAIAVSETCTGLGPEITNCTFYNNFASSGSGGVDLVGGEGDWTTVRNCIFQDNTPTDLSSSNLGSTCGWPTLYAHYSVLQSDSYDHTVLENCVVADPCFADPCDGDYHLKSAAGRWDANSESWVTDDVTSAGIDGGDPNSNWTGELWPHGKRINMGAYGGTAEASMSLSSIGNIANLDDDVNDIVDGTDLGLFVARWCYEEPLLAEDLDRDGLVNFVDFAIFAAECSGVTVAETSLSYQIEDCHAGAKAAVESGETRFTATVVGSYIHFEDMMVANCCPDELFLEMDVDGNAITIYEREVLVMPCFCICDYPVTATLGPFEAGVYTLEVYEDYGGFIGSTIVTVGP